MGMTAALKLRRVVRNTRMVLAMEALAACRALDLLAPLRSVPLLEEARERVRAVSPPFEGDRRLDRDMAAIDRLIASGALQLE